MRAITHSPAHIYYSLYSVSSVSNARNHQLPCLLGIFKFNCTQSPTPLPIPLSTFDFKCAQSRAPLPVYIILSTQYPQFQMQAIPLPCPSHSVTSAITNSRDRAPFPVTYRSLSISYIHLTSSCTFSTPTSSRSKVIRSQHYLKFK